MYPCRVFNKKANPMCAVQTPLFFDNRQEILNFSCSNHLFNLSSLNAYTNKSTSKGFAIKYVTEGIERYTINNQVYNIGPGNYLLLNGEVDHHVEIEQGNNVKGICITITTSLVEELIGSLRQPGTAYADPALARFFYTGEFLENQYQSDFTQLGRKIQKIGAAVENNQFHTTDIHEELFFELAEYLVADQVQVFKQLQDIPSIKVNTRKDLYRRINRGREYIDTYFLSDLPIKEIAREAAMSEYHFFRLFKKVYRVSPHQYILHKRLAAGRALLLQQQPVSSVALDCGFADIFSFSKAFKKHFGISPSAVLKNSSF